MSDAQLKASLIADAGQFSAEMAKAVKANTDFMTSERLKAEVVRAQERAVAEATASASAANQTLSAQTIRQIERTTASYVQQAQRLEYSKAQMREFRAEELGVAEATKQYRDSLAQAEAASDKLGHTTSRARTEMLVLAHEASQGNWKNFGGSLMVLGESLDVMKYALNPVVLGIAALAGVSYLAVEAMHSATESNLKFNQSLALTSNWAGVTNDTAANLAKTVSGDVGTSFQTARAAVDAAVASGRVLGTDLQTVTELALLMAKSTGESFDKSLDSVIKQADGVSKAAIDWEKSHHDMSQATLQHIEALDKAGDHTTALRVLYNQELATMQTGTTTTVSAMTAVWNGFLDRWGKFKRGLAGTQTLQDQRSTLVDQMNSGDYNPLGIHDEDYKKQIAAIDEQIAAQTREKAKVDEVAAAKASLAEIDTKTIEQLKQGASNEEKRTTAIKAANDAYARRVDLAKTAGFSGDALAAMTSGYASQRDKLIADAQRQYKDPATPKAKAYTDDAATRELQAANETQAALRAQLDTHEKIGTEQQKQIKFEQLIADLKNKQTLTADQKSLLASSAQIDAVLKQNTALEQQNRLKDEREKLDQRSSQLMESLSEQQRTQRENYQRSLNAIGQGSFAQQQVAAYDKVNDAERRAIEQLTKSTAKDLLGTPQFAADVAKIRASTDESRKIVDDYYADLKQKQADWTNGARQAIANYMDDAANKMKQTESLFNTVTSGMEDVWVQFATTGKLSFASLTTSVIADIARMQAKAAISSGLGFLGSLFPSLFGTSTAASTTTGLNTYGFVMPTKYASGGLVSGAGTGTSDSILAHLSNGEGVLTADAMKRLGSRRLDALNSGASIDSLPRFANGGTVGAAVSNSSTGGSGNVNISIAGGQAGAAGDGYSLAELSQLKNMVQGWVDQRIARKSSGQGGLSYQLRNGLAT